VTQDAPRSTASTPTTPGEPVVDTDDRAARREFETPSGRIVGRVDGGVVRVLGVPYAEADRFEPPRPVAPWSSPLLAFDRAPASPQVTAPGLDALIEGAAVGMVDDEHCQRLSITLPADLLADERVPVMVWIHGGSYVSGAGDLRVYDPRALVAEQRVIVVTVTYRLGMLGFFGVGDEVPANLGLLDQLAAVRWVHDTIEAFGGDSSRITLFGQSAGGDAIAHLMISEGARGLFARAIVQSAPLGIARGRSRMVAAMTEAVGTPRKDAPLDELLAGQSVAERAAKRFGLRGGMAFGVQYGRAPLPAESAADEAWREVAPEIDLLIGATADETAVFAEFSPFLQRLFGLPVVGRAIRRVMVDATTKAVYHRAGRAFAERHRAAGGRVSTFRFTWEPEGTAFGAAHITELPLLLGGREAWAHTRLIGTTDWDDVDRRGRKVRQVWADFARTGTIAADATAGLADTLVVLRR
jgi:para-nitrobenzyl esterase